MWCKRALTCTSRYMNTTTSFSPSLPTTIIITNILFSYKIASEKVNMMTSSSSSFDLLSHTFSWLHFTMFTNNALRSSLFLFCLGELEGGRGGRGSFRIDSLPPMLLGWVRYYLFPHCVGTHPSFH